MASSTLISTPPDKLNFTIKDYRSLPILIFYLALAAFLSIRICISIYKASLRPRQQPRTPTATSSNISPSIVRCRHVGIYLYTLLATLSLLATWYYMFAFFAASYKTWLSRNGPTSTATTSMALTRLELWLRQTKLFKEAWQTVVETPARTWWSGQIFLYTTGWSLFLGVMGGFRDLYFTYLTSVSLYECVCPLLTKSEVPGRRYTIPHVWMYMLLGQIVAISFAMNLFFLSVLVYRPPLLSPSTTSTSSRVSAQARWLPPLWLEVVPLLISLMGAALVPYVAHTKHFLLVLLVPHLLLFVPAILRPTRADDGRNATASEEASLTRRYTTLFKLLFILSVLLQVKATYDVISSAGPSTGIQGIVKILLNAMYEHPAVSSVSWDVVFCAVGVVTWADVHSWDLRKMLGLDQRFDEIAVDVHEKEQ